MAVAVVVHHVRPRRAADLNGVQAHWTIDELEDQRVYRCRAQHENAPLSIAQFLEALEEESIAQSLRDLLNGLPLQAYFWELPALRKQTVGRPLEFVVTRSENLAGTRADWSDFREPLARAARHSDIAVFENLGGDALLVVPDPVSGDEPWAHLAAFARHAPDAIWGALFRETARAVTQRLSERPLWLSTSGTGVPWLHVRLDSRPKYYVYAPYRSPG